MVSLFVTAGSIAGNGQRTVTLGRMRWQGNLVKQVNANPSVFAKTNHVLLKTISQQR